MTLSRAVLAALLLVGGCGGSTPGSGPGPGTTWSFDSGPPIAVALSGNHAPPHTLIAIDLADHDDDGMQDLGFVLTTANQYQFAVEQMRGLGDGTFGAVYPGFGHVSAGPPSLGRGEVMGPGQEGFVLGTASALAGSTWYSTIRTIGHRTTSGDTMEVGGSDAQSAAIVGIAVGDWNGDGTDDVAMADSQGTQVLTWLSLGESGLVLAAPLDLPAGHSPFGVAAGDWEGDGDDDIFVTYGNTGYGASIAGLPLTAVPWGANLYLFEPVTGDFDGDGVTDVAGVVTQENQPTKLGFLRGNGNGTFAALQTTTPTDVTLNTTDWPYLHAADLDDDGKTDLILRIPGGDQTCVFLGTAAGTFAFFPDPDLVGGHNDLIAVGDVDGDGDQDLVIGHTAGMTVRVLLSNRIQPTP